MLRTEGRRGLGYTHIEQHTYVHTHIQTHTRTFTYTYTPTHRHILYKYTPFLSGRILGLPTAAARAVTLQQVCLFVCVYVCFACFHDYFAVLVCAVFSKCACVVCCMHDVRFVHVFAFLIRFPGVWNGDSLRTM